MSQRSLLVVMDPLSGAAAYRAALPFYLQGDDGMD